MTRADPASLPHALRDVADRDDPRSGLRFLDRHEQPTWLPFPEVWDRAARVAGGLRAAGVAPGDRVALVLPTAPSFADAFFGCQLAGAIPVPLYPPVRLGRLDEYVDRTAAMLRAVRAAAIVSDARIRKLLGRLVERETPRLGVLDAEALRSAADPVVTLPSPDDLAMVQFSSGTTVDPKPVGLTHAQVLANARRITDAIVATTPHGQDPEPAGVSWLPLYHDMGLIGGMFPALLAPGPTTLVPPELFLARPAVWLRAVSRWRGTISPAPNFAYALCVERVRDEELAGVDLSTWRMALNGAEPISAATLRAFTERFAPWGFRADAHMPVYGLSEASLAVTFTPPGRGFRSARFDADALAHGRAAPSDHGPELVSVGVPLPDFDVRIVQDGAALPEDRIGRVHVRGPSVMQGYLDRDDQPFVDGWLDTGDLGFVHEGELYVTGRAKDVLILRGRNHAPHDVERAVDEVPGVRTGCAAAVADVGEHGERLIVFVEVREARPDLTDACARAIKASTGLTPDLVVLLDPGTLPRTSSGKIRRAETLRRFHTGSLAPPRAVNALTMAGELARSALGWWRAGRGAPGGPR